MKRFLLIALAAAVTLAGCASNQDIPTVDDAKEAMGQAADEAGRQAAKLLLENVVENLPDRYGFTMTVSKNGGEALRADGMFDRDTQESFTKLRGDAASFGGAQGIANGINIYTTPRGAVYAFPTATVVQSTAIPQLDGIVPSSLFQPDTILLEMSRNITVKSATPTTIDGKVAWSIRAEAQMGSGPVDATVVITQDPPRLVRLTSILPTSGPQSALSGAQIVVDMRYGNDVENVPANLLRALDLAPRVETRGNTTTWTFHGGNVTSDALTAIVQPADASSNLATTRTILELALVDGTASGDGHIVRFADNDADGIISAGDTLSLTTDANATIARLVLHDAVADAYLTADFSVVLRALFGR